MKPGEKKRKRDWEVYERKWNLEKRRGKETWKYMKGNEIWRRMKPGEKKNEKKYKSKE